MLLVRPITSSCGMLGHCVQGTESPSSCSLGGRGKRDHTEIDFGDDRLREVRAVSMIPQCGTWRGSWSCSTFISSRRCSASAGSTIRATVRGAGIRRREAWAVITKGESSTANSSSSASYAARYRRVQTARCPLWRSSPGWASRGLSGTGRPRAHGKSSRGALLTPMQRMHASEHVKDQLRSSRSTSILCEGERAETD